MTLTLTKWTKGTKYPNNADGIAITQIMYWGFFHIFTSQSLCNKLRFDILRQASGELRWASSSFGCSHDVCNMRGLKTSALNMVSASKTDKLCIVWDSPNRSIENFSAFGMKTVKTELPVATIPFTNLKQAKQNKTVHQMPRPCRTEFCPYASKFPLQYFPSMVIHISWWKTIKEHSILICMKLFWSMFALAGADRVCVCDCKYIGWAK